MEVRKKYNIFFLLKSTSKAKHLQLKFAQLHMSVAGALGKQEEASQAGWRSGDMMLSTEGRGVPQIPMWGQAPQGLP